MSIARWLWNGLALGALAVGAAVGLYAAGPPLGQGEMQPLELRVEAVPLDASNPARTEVGRLRYLGGVRLTSAEKLFGGLSALLWAPDCRRLLAVTDTGSFVLLVPQETGERLTGVSAAWMAPIRDTAGRPPANKREADAEALSRAPGSGAITVWFEGRARAQRYPGLDPCRESTLATPASTEEVPAPMAGWPVNGGPEAAADAPGVTLVLSEEAGPGPELRWALQVAGSDLRIGTLTLDDAAFVPTALDLLEAGPPPVFLLLRRSFSPLAGVAARVDQLTLGRDGLTLAPVASFRPPLAVDNMEGLAVRRDGDRRFIYLVSDDNFNRAQQTLLLKFELLPG